MISLKLALLTAIAAAAAAAVLWAAWNVAVYAKHSADVLNVAKALYNMQGAASSAPAALRAENFTLLEGGRYRVGPWRPPPGVKSLNATGLLVGDCPRSVVVDRNLTGLVEVAPRCWAVPPRLYGGELYVYYAPPSAASAYAVQIVDAGEWATPFGTVKVRVVMVTPAG